MRFKNLGSVSLISNSVWHSRQALTLCQVLVERGIDIHHGDVAWSNLEVMLQGQ